MNFLMNDFRKISPSLSLSRSLSLGDFQYSLLPCTHVYICINLALDSSSSSSPTQDNAPSRCLYLSLSLSLSVSVIIFFFLTHRETEKFGIYEALLPLLLIKIYLLSIYIIHHHPLIITTILIKHDHNRSTIITLFPSDSLQTPRAFVLPDPRRGTSRAVFE